MTPSRAHVDRSRSRAWALEIYYRWEASENGEALRDVLVDVQRTRRIAPRRLDYIRRLLTALDTHMDEVDGHVARALDNWRLERLALIDRGILRIGAVEMLYFDDVPPKVSIQEAVRLAERYGGEESPRFVNGVLDALMRQAQLRS